MSYRNALLLILTFIIAVSACATVPGSSTAKPDAPPSSPQTDMPSPGSTPTIDPDRQTIAEAKLSLKLPQGWSILGPLETSSEGMPAYDLYILGIEPASSDGPGSSKIAVADAGSWTPEQFVQAQCSTCPAQLMEAVTLGSRSAQRTQIGGGGVPILVTWYFVENNGKLIALAIHDPENLESLEDVLLSIQFE